MLPSELRMAIWELAIEPRTIELYTAEPVTTAQPGTRFSALRLICTTPVPAIVHVCHESRNLGLYRKSLIELGFLDGAQPWYIWADLAIDMLSLSIDETPLSVFKPVAAKVTYIKFKRAISSGEYYWGHVKDDVFHRSQHVEELRDFVNLKEIYIINTDDARIWHGGTPVQSVLDVCDSED